jgi:hypothetical protein
MSDIHSSVSLQGELEHRNSKSRYTRTSRKGFVKQLVQIERRQARIHRIRVQLVSAKRSPPETVASDPDVPYNIGKFQNCPVDLTQFVQMHADDPATQVLCPPSPLTVCMLMSFDRVFFTNCAITSVPVLRPCCVKR